MMLAAKKGNLTAPVHVLNETTGRTVCGQKVTEAWRSFEPGGVRWQATCNLCNQLLRQEAQPEATASQAAVKLVAGGQACQAPSTRRERVEEASHKQVWDLANDHQEIEHAVRAAREIMYVVRVATDLRPAARGLIEDWLDRFGRTPLRETPPGDSRGD